MRIKLWYNGSLKRLFQYLAVLVAGGLFIWIITILLDDDNWIALSALATLVLAIAAFWAIMDNRHARMVDKRERLLKEIIEWALDIMVCGVERDIELLWHTPDRGLSVLSQMANTFKYLLRKSTYIKSIILPSWNHLSKDIEEIRGQLDVHIKYIEKYKKEPNNKTQFDITYNHRDEVNKLAVKIIKEATKIKTKDIS